MDNFSFKYPGADHHARWMSKAIYFLKLALLSGQISDCEEHEVAVDDDEETKKRKRKKVKKSDGMIMTETEKKNVDEVAEFIGLFYAQAFFESPLSSSAPYNDLVFMSNMRRYRQYRPVIADACLASCLRHLWYVTPQLIVFSFVDPQIPSTERESMAKELFKIKRLDRVNTGKPTFPVIAWPETQSLPNLVSLLTSESWLLFDLLGMTGTHVGAVR